MSKLGIIAAKGGLSQKLIEHSKSNQTEIFIVAIEGETDPDLVLDSNHTWIKLGEIGKAVKAMQAANVKRVVFVGSLRKPDILSLKVDWLGTKLLAKIVKDKFFGDDKLLSSVVSFIQEQGFNVVGVHEILNDLVVEAGIFTTARPNKQDEIDIELGIKIVTQLGALDIGQAVIVQNAIVLGVEAIEGTDNLIKRCSELKRADNGGTLIKFAKPGQELRMDLPTIGIKTIENMHKAGFKGIIIEAKRSIFLDQNQVIEYANQYNMFVGAI